MRSLTFISACAALALVLSACASCGGGGDDDPFVECRDDTSCGLQPGGECLVNPATGHQFCAYPDPDCGSGLRWSSLDVEDSISGMCVAGEIFDAGIDAPVDAEVPDASDMVAPSVLAISPVDGATMVSTTTTVTITFSEAIDPATVTPASFQVTAPGGAIDGEFNFDGAMVTFIPSARLDPDIEFDVAITTAVRDLAGNALEDAFASAFTTRPGGWTAGELLETDQNSAVRDIDAMMRSGGRGAVIWSANTCAGQNCADPYMIVAVPYAGGVFSAAETIHSANTSLTGMQDPHITVDSAGNMVAVWTQRDGSYSSVWSSHRPVAGTWTTPVTIETEQLGHVANLAFSGDASGNAFAVWEQADGTTTNVWANRYTISSGWGTPVRLEASTMTATEPGIVAADDGTALAMFRQNGGEYFARYSGGTWSTAALVGGVATDGGVSPVLRVDSLGGVLAIWIKGTDLYSARYNGAWTTPAAIDAPTVNDVINVPPALATSQNGKAFAIWAQGPTGTRNLYQAMWDGSWNNAFLLEALSGISNYPSVAFGTGDRAMAVWNQSGTAEEGWSAEHRPVAGWQQPELIMQGDGGVVLYDDQRNVFINVYAQATVGFASMYFTEYE